MGEHYELFYYDSKGLIEPARYILSIAEKTHNVTWKDNRTPITQFPTVLPPDWKARCPFGQVPLLEFNGKQLSQSQAIIRFLARKFNLTGADDFDAAKCDEYADTTKDFFSQFSALYHEKDETKRAEIKKNAIVNAKQKFLSKFNEIVGQNGGKHLVGNQLTWVDIYLSHFIDNVQRINEIQLVEDLPHLQTLVQNTFATPEIKGWIEKRPVTKY